uniref:Uncharacterized protein n=1 Tax=Osmundaria fimbriata TaxID=228265 RepID=A0A1Z1M542_OSMFI|nr:hypothetical protein [Osmundaria fimbriata]ARW60915.1 hypothetical protein [Osmundaria fimbriata]
MNLTSFDRKVFEIYKNIKSKNNSFHKLLVCFGKVEKNIS